jgi:lactam utilization protein B
MTRKKLTDAQKQFIAGDEINHAVSQQADNLVLTSASQSASQSASTEISADIGVNLKQELFSDRQEKESSIRFTVDVPKSLNKRLSQLSVDTGKPKTELVRRILNQALSSLDY